MGSIRDKYKMNDALRLLFVRVAYGQLDQAPM
jgi:hypothetical protein